MKSALSHNFSNSGKKQEVFFDFGIIESGKFLLHAENPALILNHSLQILNLAGCNMTWLQENVFSVNQKSTGDIFMP
jgi:hypothetical protein